MVHNYFENTLSKDFHRSWDQRSEKASKYEDYKFESFQNGREADRAINIEINFRRFILLLKRKCITSRLWVFKTIIFLL